MGIDVHIFNVINSLIEIWDKEIGCIIMSQKPRDRLGKDVLH